MFNFFLVVVIGYVLLVGALYAFQRQMIYHPDKNIGPPERYGLEGFFEYFTTTADGENIQLWYRVAAPGFPTIVYYHGNSYNLSDRAGIYAALVKRGFGLLAVSYRGYGKSTGSPDEQGIYNDARAGIKFMQDKFHISPPNLILYGESLGTGVAVQMGTEFNVGAVVLQSPYMSVAGRAAEIYSFVPVLMLIKDKFATIDKIANVKAPILIFHGELDTTIPIAHGKAVFAAATSPKEAYFLANTGHNDFDSNLISEHVLAFAKKYNLIKP